MWRIRKTLNPKTCGRIGARESGRTGAVEWGNRKEEEG
jgi:hypothetical protein